MAKKLHNCKSRFIFVSTQKEILFFTPANVGIFQLLNFINIMTTYNFNERIFGIHDAIALADVYFNGSKILRCGNCFILENLAPQSLEDLKRKFPDEEFEQTQVYAEDGTVTWRNSDFVFRHPHGEPNIRTLYSEIKKEQKVVKNEIFFKVPYNNGIEEVNHPPMRNAIFMYLRYATAWHYDKQKVQTQLFIGKTAKTPSGASGGSSAIALVVGYIK